MKNLNVVELNAQELREVEGGNRYVKAFTFIMEAAGIYDAIDDFKSGWNSVHSYGSGAGGSW